jgi:hypothetical protein
MNKKHFPWESNPKAATAAAEEFARALKVDEAYLVDVHVWRDPGRRVTTVEWK